MSDKWYCQLMDHEFDGVGTAPYKVLCGPHAGRECICREGIHTAIVCDCCGEGHQARCAVWACPEHFEEVTNERG